MSDETPKAEQVQNALWAGKLGLALIWSAFCTLFWLIWLTGTVDRMQMDGTGTDTAIGMAGCLVTGCMGSMWMGGLLLLLVVYAIVRR